MKAHPDRRLLSTLPFIILAVAPCALGDNIRLRASVRLPSDADAVRLSHIADLEGTEAEAHADLLIEELGTSSAPIEIRIRHVRACLDDAGVHWGRVNLSGRQVVVRPPDRPAAANPVAMAGVTLESPDARGDRGSAGELELLAHEIKDDSTLRGLVIAGFLRELDVAPDDLRLVFDRAKLEELESRSRGARYEITPQGSLRSDRVKLAIRAWRDGRVETTGALAVQPLVRVSCPVLTREIERNATVEKDDFGLELRWLPPSRAELICDPSDAAGRLSSRRLEAGDALRKQHVRRRTLVERGDRVNVRCLVGGIVISLQAEARADGAEGETIELRKLGERSTFVASVTGPGEAVVDMAR